MHVVYAQLGVLDIANNFHFKCLLSQIIHLYKSQHVFFIKIQGNEINQNNVMARK
jgi:hypothetical protein